MVERLANLSFLILCLCRLLESVEALLASLCAEIVEYWNDLAVYFGTYRTKLMSELRLVSTLEVHVFDDAMMRPCFVVLWLVLR